MTLGASIAACVLAALFLALAFPAAAEDWGRYKRPDPARFAQGVAAYDSGNYQQAYEIWLPLARHGDIAALFNVGLMLRDGRGIPQDLPRAVEFFERAAQWNHLGSEVNLAEMYHDGRGMPRDYVKSARWLMIAARRGHLPSTYKLAGMFERGEGMEQNLDAARMLYLIAARAGYELAAHRLAVLAGSGPGPARTATMAPVPNPVPAPPDIRSLSLELSMRRLRGTAGDLFELGNAGSGVFTLRASSGSAPAERAPTLPSDLPLRGTGLMNEPADLANVCPRPAGFDAPEAMCRMPPVRD